MSKKLWIPLVVQEGHEIEFSTGPKSIIFETEIDFRDLYEKCAGIIPIFLSKKAAVKAFPTAEIVSMEIDRVKPSVPQDQN